MTDTARVATLNTSPHEVTDFATNAAERDLEVIIAAAGGAAHLAGTVAAPIRLPVIGVPLSGSLDGIDSLLATLQMSPGAPMATVAVDGAANAALLAVAILSLSDPALTVSLTDSRSELATTAGEG